MACMSGTNPVYLVHLVSFIQPITRDRQNRPNRPDRPNEQDRLADFFSIPLPQFQLFSVLTMGYA
jgi:hypothetical protein